jgi:hypothetical protein
LANGIDNQNIQGAQKTKLRKINDPMKKWTNELPEQSKHLMKKCSTSLAISLKHFKIPPHCIRMATIKNTTTNVAKELGEKEPSYAAGRNVN